MAISIWRYLMNMVGQFLFRRIPAVVFFSSALVLSAIAVFTAAMLEGFLGFVVFFFIMVMIGVLWAAGMWYLFRPPEDVVMFLKNRRSGMSMFIFFFLPILILYLGAYVTCLPQDWRGIIARISGNLILTIIGGATTYSLIKGERL